MAEDISSTEETTPDAGPAAGVKARRQATGKGTAAKKAEAAEPAADGDDQPDSDAEADPRSPEHEGNIQHSEVSMSAGIHSHSVGGPETLTGSFLGNQTDVHKYVVADDDAYLGFVPLHATTPSTKRLWSKGQMVRKDFYTKWNGRAATQAHEATVLVDYNQPDHEPVAESAQS
jgi:hypothetical protein